jgi:cell division protein FtsB
MSKSSPKRSRSRVSEHRARVGAGPSRRRWLQLGLVFVAAALIVNSLIGERGLLETWRVKREHDELAASMWGLRTENARLAEEIQRLREDPKAIEDVARRDLGLIRPGEVVFVVKDVPVKVSDRQGSRQGSR